MKRIATRLLFLLLAFSVHSCFIDNAFVSREDILKNIYISDNSYIGLLNNCNFEGKIENKNRFGISNVGFKGTLYNTETKQYSYYEFKLGVPVTMQGSATYKEKIFVGRHMRVERVEVICAEKGY